MKKDGFLEKSQALFSRNYLKMHQFFWDHEKPSDFIGSILSIRKDLGVSGDLPFRDIHKEATGSTEKFYLLEDKYQKIQANFLKKYAAKKTALQKGVIAILRKNNLGEEWEETITSAIITGACFPPRYNASISRDKEKGTITFTINKDTTKNDLDVAWKYSECLRKSLFGNKQRAFYPATTTFNNHNKYVETIIEKVENPEVEEPDPAVGIVRTRPTRDKDIIPTLYPENQTIDQDKKSLIKLKVNRFRNKKDRGH